MNRSRRSSHGPGPPERPPIRLLPQASDDRLVELVGEGDDSAFEALCDRHVLDAFVFAHQMLESLEDAEQAVHHAFAAAHAYLAAGGPKVTFEPWLYTILSNHCLAMLRARRRPREERGDAVVVDIGEWRRKRKLLGVTLPLLPGGATVEKVLGACGLGGAGTAAVGSSVIGGTLAKVAVVAALVAGGAGVAGTVAPDRDGKDRGAEVAQAGLRAAAEGTSWQSAGDVVVARAGDLAEGADARVRAVERKRLGGDRIGRPPVAEQDPARPGEGVGDTAPSGGGTVPPAPAPAHPTAPAPVSSTTAVTETVEAQTPSTEELPAVDLPVVDDLRQVLDDAVVVPPPPLDVQELLSHAVDPPPS